MDNLWMSIGVLAQLSPRLDTLGLRRMEFRNHEQLKVVVHAISGLHNLKHLEFSELPYLDMRKGGMEQFNMFFEALPDSLESLFMAQGSLPSEHADESDAHELETSKRSGKLFRLKRLE
ncbi:hypothetical protein BGX33_000704 [Mortierella sp. NVP41]|nr:hypothetical protein BGX33_000704 [Mortierella sp. NVP41]